jgi:hypothetical protein
MLMLLFGLAIAYFYGVDDTPENSDPPAHDHILGPPASP